MERLKVRYVDAERAIGTLREILLEPFSAIVRDASIQRFDYTFEACWKFIKEYLKISVIRLGFCVCCFCHTRMPLSGI